MTLDLFGNEILSKEELKAKEKAEKEEAKKKAKEEEAKKKELESKKLALTTKLNSLKDKKKANPEDVAKIETSLESIKNCVSLEELETISSEYSEELKNLVPKKYEAQKTEEKEFTYPFNMYFGHDYRDVSGMFEEGKKYKESEITKILVEHGFKEFKYASKVQYEYFEDENCVFPKIALGNRG